MTPKIHIKIGDTGWIIEKMAKTLTDSIPRVTYGTHDDNQADITYHMPYATYKTRTCQKHIGYFTHLEHSERLKNKFFDSAANFERRICISNKTLGILKSAGFDKLSVISPGVDLNKFTPKLKIGVVGRTYTTGRKGENLIKEVMDIPGISWQFTGNGWPIESQNITDAEMPNFYNSVDYILIPSTNEGGPMCVLEALACGRPIIASNVGWVSEFPHIEFETGNAKSLRTVLIKLQESQTQLRSAVLSRTWDNWINQHDILFKEISN
jgi:glycosyltransferase involved in cell wall biosynthesis